MQARSETLNLAGAVVAFLLLLTLGFLAYALVYVEIPVGNNNTLTILVGVLAANVGTVVNWFYGGSLTNKAQTETISTLAETAKTAQSTLSAATPTPDTTTTTTVTAVTTPPAPTPAASVPDADTVVEIEPGQTAIVSAKDKP